MAAFVTASTQRLDSISVLTTLYCYEDETESSLGLRIDAITQVFEERLRDLGPLALPDRNSLELSSRRAPGTMAAFRKQRVLQEIDRWFEEQGQIRILSDRALLSAGESFFKQHCTYSVQFAMNSLRIALARPNAQGLHVLLMGPGRVEPYEQLAGDPRVARITLAGADSDALACIGKFDPAVRRKFTFVRLDFTGLFDHIAEIFAERRTSVEYIAQITELYGQDLPIITMAKAQVVFSLLVMSQLWIGIHTFVENRLEPVIKDLGRGHPLVRAYIQAQDRCRIAVQARYLQTIHSSTVERGMVAFADTLSANSISSFLSSVMNPGATPNAPPAPPTVSFPDFDRQRDRLFTLVPFSSSASTLTWPFGFTGNSLNNMGIAQVTAMLLVPKPLSTTTA